MDSLLKERKGNISDIFIFLMIIVFLGISFIIVIFMNTEIQGVIQDTTLNSTDASSSILDSFENINTNVVGRGFVIFFAFMIIGIMVSAFLTRIHPVFMFLYIIVLGVTLLVAVLMGNIYADMTENAHLAVVASSQPQINFIMLNLVKITVAVGALSMVVALSKIFTSPGGISGGTDI